MWLQNNLKGKYQKAVTQSNAEQQLASASRYDFEYSMITSLRTERNQQGRLVSHIKRGRISTFQEVRVDDIVWIVDGYNTTDDLVKCRIVNVESKPDIYNPKRVVMMCDIETIGR